MSDLISRFEAMPGRIRLIAEVLTALEAEQVEHDVRGNAIYVSEDRRDNLRLQLAGRGLPASGGAGYELLDELSGFGTTSQMFDAAYRRAQEGEIARTIASAPAIRSARVHLSRAENSPFRRNQQATASVTVTMANAPLSSDRARALRHLVASSVPDLMPEAVSIIDAQAGIIIGEDSDDPAANASDRAAQMRANVLRLLEARVGPGRAFVEINVDTTLDTEIVTERVIDPDSRVAISTDVEEDLEQATGSGPGAVTVASNLPDGDAAAGGSAACPSRFWSMGWKLPEPTGRRGSRGPKAKSMRWRSLSAPQWVSMQRAATF